MSQQRWGQLLMSVALLILALMPSIFDFNLSHVLHPDWPGHARFHLVWSIGVLFFNAVLGLYFIWFYRSDQRFGARVAGILGLGPLAAFFTSAATMRHYGGTLHDAGGVPRWIGLDPNLIGFAATAVVLCVGLRLALKRDPW